MTVQVQREDFDPGAEIKELSRETASTGALICFIGLCRDMAGDRAITAMTLEHYPGMTERHLADLEAEARRRWPIAGCRIVHRFGRLLPGDRIVLVAVTTPHRHDSFQACAFLMDRLKTEAPFWKAEETPDGIHWVDATVSDDQAAARWTP